MSELPTGLKTAHEQVRDELRRADTKATGLLSVTGAGFAGVIALAARPMDAVVSVVMWSAAVPMLTAVVLLLVVLCPRLNPNPEPGSWLYGAEHGPAALLDTYSSESEATGEAAARHVCTLARIARSKFRIISRAVVLLVAGLAVLAGSLVLAVVL